MLATTLKASSSSFIFPNQLASLQMWLDSGDTSSMNISHQNITQTGAGTAGAHTITASADISNTIPAGARLKIGGSGIYTVSSVSGNIVGTMEALTTTYPASSSIALEKISQINDKSGNNRNAVQASVANRPVFVPGASNGRSVADFRDSLVYMNTGPLNIGQAFTVAMVLKLNHSIATGGAFRRLLRMDNDNNSLFIRKATYNIEQKAVLPGQAENRNTLNYTGYDNSSYAIIISEVNVSNRTMYFQDRQSAFASNIPATGFTTPFQNWHIGDNSAQASFRLAELLFYKRSLYIDEVLKIINYLRVKWGG